jgi:hypothetical protein
MRNKTRRLYAAYEAEIAKLNGVDRVDRKFSVQPSIQQRLESKVQESSEFLSQINIHGVTEQEGEKIGLGVSGPVASTTDTPARPSARPATCRRWTPTAIAVSKRTRTPTSPTSGWMPGPSSPISRRASATPSYAAKHWTAS